MRKKTRGGRTTGVGAKGEKKKSGAAQLRTSLKKNRTTSGEANRRGGRRGKTKISCIKKRRNGKDSIAESPRKRVVTKREHESGEKDSFLPKKGNTSLHAKDRREGGGVAEGFAQKRIGRTPAPGPNLEDKNGPENPRTEQALGEKKGKKKGAPRLNRCCVMAGGEQSTNVKRIPFSEKENVEKRRNPANGVLAYRRGCSSAATSREKGGGKGNRLERGLNTRGKEKNGQQKCTAASRT